MLTQEQLDSFHRDGYLIMRGLITGEELQLLTKAANEVQRMGIAKEGEDHLYAKPADGEKVYWRSEKMWKRGDIFQAVTVNPELLENIGQVIGDYFLPLNASLVVKQAHKGTPVPWHQDPPYNDPKRLVSFPSPNFTTDIYLDHSDPDNGCVYAIPGRHLVGHVEMQGLSEADLFEKYGAIPIQMEAGDVLFHCVSTPHGSDANRTPLQRRIFYLHFLSYPAFRDSYESMQYFANVDWVSSQKALANSMQEARARLGWMSFAERGTMELADQGYRFTSVPVSDKDHWVKLIEAIPLKQQTALKKLKWRDEHEQ